MNPIVGIGEMLDQPFQGVLLQAGGGVAQADQLAGRPRDRLVEDGEITPACVQTCPTKAITFGDRKDPNSRVSKLQNSERAYKVLDHHLNTQPAVSYLNDIRYKA